MTAPAVLVKSPAPPFRRIKKDVLASMAAPLRIIVPLFTKLVRLVITIDCDVPAIIVPFSAAVADKMFSVPPEDTVTVPFAAFMNAALAMVPLPAIVPLLVTAPPVSVPPAKPTKPLVLFQSGVTLRVLALAMLKVPDRKSVV